MKKLITLGAALALPFLLSACGPPNLEEVREIKPNETAFLIQLEGNANQQKMPSEQYLQQNMVAAKRVSIPHRELVTGRGPGEYTWIPTARLIVVDRSPITREWTSLGANATLQTAMIGVESSESIGWHMGVTVTASIPEDMAAKFLYNFGGKPLNQVADENIRDYVQSQLSTEFGEHPLDYDTSHKKEVFAAAEDATKKFFGARGIEIDNLGYTEGMIYDNDKIQDSIDNNYKSEMSITAAQNEAKAQDARNAMKVAMATADRQAAEQFAQAQAAGTAKYDMETRRMYAQAALNISEKWHGGVPQSITEMGGQGGAVNPLAMFNVNPPVAPAGK
jgi:hypothetical protein